MKYLDNRDLQEIKFAIQSVYDLVENRESKSTLIKQIAARKFELIERIDNEMKLKGA